MPNRWPRVGCDTRKPGVPRVESQDQRTQTSTNTAITIAATIAAGSAMKRSLRRAFTRLEPVVPPVVGDGEILPQDAANLRHGGAARVLVELRVLRRRGNDGDLGSDLVPHHPCAAHVVRRAHQQ